MASIKELNRFLEKAEKILADAPIFANDKDKMALLTRKFRLEKSDGKIILRLLKS